ncbi:MAG: hypothetical protein ABIK22_07590 [candidate division WOR-3 bacterium]
MNYSARHRPHITPANLTGIPVSILKGLSDTLPRPELNTGTGI